jgi:hypothetical protein
MAADRNTEICMRSALWSESGPNAAPLVNDEGRNQGAMDESQGLEIALRLRLFDGWS